MHAYMDIKAAFHGGLQQGQISLAPSQFSSQLPFLGIREKPRTQDKSERREYAWRPDR
jgi:hypothetical protein